MPAPVLLLPLQQDRGVFRERGTMLDLIRTHHDWPTQGVDFLDISPLLADPAALQKIVTKFSHHAAVRDADIIAGIEARGFILGAAVATLTGAGFLMLRKSGKLPAPAASSTYGLEYGTDSLEAPDIDLAGKKVAIIDDVLATGGTALAAAILVSRLGGEVTTAAFLLEVQGLTGAKAITHLNPIIIL